MNAPSGLSAVVEPSIALEEDYDVLVVSDRWPALTYGFVGAVHQRGRGVLGVFDPDEPAGKDHLVELGVDATIAADADVAEFVTVLQSLDATVAGASDGPGAGPSAVDPGNDRSLGALVAVSGPRGSGITEVALGIAVALAERQLSVVLLDAHEAAPALAGRLGLGLEPNLRSAVDACARSYVTDPETYETVETSPFVLAGQGPWGPQLKDNLRAALTDAAGTGN